MKKGFLLGFLLASILFIILIVIWNNVNLKNNTIYIDNNASVCILTSNYWFLNNLSSIENSFEIIKNSCINNELMQLKNDNSCIKVIQAYTEIINTYYENIKTSNLYTTYTDYLNDDTRLERKNLKVKIETYLNDSKKLVDYISDNLNSDLNAEYVIIEHGNINKLYLEIQQSLLDYTLKLSNDV